jgi:hypothetical protein
MVGMVDITKCHGRRCKVRETCARHTKPSDDIWQAYADFSLLVQSFVEFVTDCEYYLEKEAR